jgi:hypothetical protein
MPRGKPKHAVATGDVREASRTNSSNHPDTAGTRQNRDMGRDVVRVSAPALRQGVHRLVGRIDWNRRAVRDAVAILALAAASLILSEWFDLFAALMKFQSICGDWGLDDLAMLLIWRQLPLRREN